MDTSDDGMNPPLNDSTANLTGKIMVVAIIVLFVVVVFVLFLHLYAKWFWWRIEDPTVPSRESRNPRRRRLIFGQDPAAAALKTGLDPAVLRALPVLIFHSEDFKEGLECAVCLSELSPGEKARLLPKCNHGFHVECIDMWFQSHSTCPLCRNPVVLSSGCSEAAIAAAGAEDLAENSVTGESLNFPTNVLFWGNQTQVSSRGACLEEGHSSQSTATTTTPLPEGMLVIDIPENHLSAALPSPAMRVVAEEEMKSPVTTRLRSLKRLLSKEKRVVCPCSSSCVEAEQ